MEVAGQFKQAAELLNHELQHPTLPAADLRQVEFDLDRLERIKKDYPYTQEALFSDLKKAVRDLTPAEYEHWLQQGRFDSRVIDGQRFFMGSSVANLFFRYPELNPRRMPAHNTAERDRRHLETCLAIREAALAEQQPYVLPKRFRTIMTVTAKADAVPAGELVRAWLPIPREYPFQQDFQWLSTSPAIQQSEAKDSPIRSVYLERPARKGKPTEFKIEYEYTMFGVWFDVKPEKVKACNPEEPALKPFVQESPHVVFTPELRALSKQIVGTETNPYLQAKKCYDWIAEHIKYSYSIEYSTIRNISDYCRTHGYGDCGQEGMLFIAFCRLNGIPARWQTGWYTFPGAKTIHDWTEIYIAPYGWMPVDPYMGIYAMRYATTLKPEQQRQIRDFYFGGLDQYRMIANSDHCQTLNPPKQSVRSDNVDFQRGELEWGGHNLYFDQFAYSLDVKEVKLPHSKTNLF